MDANGRDQDDVGYVRFKAVVRTKGLEQGVQKFRCGESAELLLRRFLTASAGDIDSAVKLLAEDLVGGVSTWTLIPVVVTWRKDACYQEWREQMDTLAISSMSCDQVLELCKCPEIKPTLIDFLPHGFLGFDKAGRPVSYRKITRKFDANQLSQAGFDIDANLKYATWLLERMCKSMGDVGQWVVIVDMSEANQVTALSAQHFPERMGTTFIVNAPYVFGACWQVAKGWINERIISKIGIYSGPDQWRPELEKILDVDMLPTELGGTTTLSYAPHSLDPAVQPQPKEQN